MVVVCMHACMHAMEVQNTCPCGSLCKSGRMRQRLMINYNWNHLRGVDDGPDGRQDESSLLSSKEEEEKIRENERGRENCLCTVPNLAKAKPSQARQNH